MVLEERKVSEVSAPGLRDEPSLRHAKSTGSISSNSSSSSCSTSFSERDSEWYLDVVLGFAEPASSPDTFLAHRFPSKLGGRPVWLYHGHSLPAPLRCAVCDKVLVFLLQVYAPVNNLDFAFHRVIYLFVCRSRGCAGGVGSARVLVGQLPRRNPFYPYDPLDWDEAAPVDVGVPSGMDKEVSCELCSFAASSRCGKCGKSRYCSRDCQRIDWRLIHRRTCGSSSTKEPSEGSGVASDDEESGVVEGKPTCTGQGDTSKAAIEKKRLSWLFKEFEIVNESCPTPGGGSENGDDEGEASDGGELRSSPPRKKGPSLQDVSADELPSSLFKQARRGRSKAEDSAFRRFSEMMQDSPSQIVRYWRGGRVLWCARDGRPDIDRGEIRGQTGSISGRSDLKHPSTTVCRRCSGPLLFEAQVLSQVLYYIGVDGARGDKHLGSDTGGCGGLNFGTIALFSCAAGCGSGEDGSGRFCYSEEVAWVQRIDERPGPNGSTPRREDLIEDGGSPEEGATNGGATNGGATV